MFRGSSVVGETAEGKTRVLHFEQTANGSLQVFFTNMNESQPEKPEDAVTIDANLILIALMTATNGTFA